MKNETVRLETDSERLEAFTRSCREGFRRGRRCVYSLPRTQRGWGPLLTSSSDEEGRISVDRSARFLRAQSVLLAWLNEESTPPLVVGQLEPEGTRIELPLWDTMAVELGHARMFCEGIGLDEQ